MLSHFNLLHQFSGATIKYRPIRLDSIAYTLIPSARSISFPGASVKIFVAVYDTRKSYKIIEIARYLETDVDGGDAQEGNAEEPVAVKSEDLMEVEESHFVEKDIAQDPPENFAKEDSADEDIPVQPKTYEKMKEGLRSLVPKHSTRMESDSFCYSFIKLFLFLLIPLCVIFASLVLREQNYQHSTVFANISVELKKRVYGQDQAVEAVGKYLQLDKPVLKMMALVGGTGVGKSYTTQIIESNFPIYSIRQYFSPISLTMNDVGFSFLYPKLIVLENLKEHDLADVVNFLKMNDKVDVNQYITVLAVFNVERMDDDLLRKIDLDQSAKTIRDSFAGANLDVKVITFELLGEDVLEKCIIDAARVSEITLSDDDFESVKQQLVTNNAGCKGAYSKVQVIGRK
ncbi:PREDICTED: uncharacterized protein LOC106741633 isoform X2 [Dinoponera quadriceps]|uniref:Uncharacterized protein LOC106741633 isoform X2 n=1 Tax=Dinoponera quadriceps TaxID=609295 RepID=A0A6P3WUJ1_DINQU|nr:PREDICTED: uncharacterized protein LOC106741633 isoform X2 [Dinoponera quadriceps]